MCVCSTGIWVEKSVTVTQSVSNQHYFLGKPPVALKNWERNNTAYTFRLPGLVHDLWHFAKLWLARQKLSRGCNITRRYCLRSDSKKKGNSSFWSHLTKSEILRRVSVSAQTTITGRRQMHISWLFAWISLTWQSCYCSSKLIKRFNRYLLGQNTICKVLG